MFEEMKSYQNTDKMLDLNQRVTYLKSVKNSILHRRDEIADALYSDLGKSKAEAEMTEIAMVLLELNYLIKNLKKLARPKKYKSSILNFPSKSYAIKEPYGLVLVIAPWNYPFNLAMIPMLGAIAAGNSVVVKSSTSAINTGKIIKKIIEEALPKEVCQIVLGGPGANKLVMDEKFDYIFFTGGKETGKIIYEKAARDMVPVTLELGGKSPCIVLKDAKLDLAAKRIVWGKLLNNGQTCVAVDYILVENEIYDQLKEKISKYIKEFYTERPLNSPYYGKIVNEVEYKRLLTLLNREGANYESDDSDLKISPTIIDANFESPIMEREIFGPIIPLIPIKDIDETIEKIRSMEVPLALYIFTESKENANYIIQRIGFGGGCINDTISHIVGHMPFGGFKDSGLGSYHGRKTFDTFVHEKSILSKATWLDPNFRYHPLNEKKLNIFKRIFK